MRRPYTYKEPNTYAEAFSQTFHDQIVAYTAVLDASAKMHHQKDHYSMLSPYAREKVAEIKGIIECLMTEELVEEQHQKEKMRMQAPISRAASQQVSGHATPVPLSPNRAYPEPPRSPYRSSMQTYERAERPSRNTQVPGAPPFAEQPYYTPPPYQPADVPYSPAQSDGVFDPEAFPVPVSAGGPYSPAAATHFQTQGPSDTLGPTTGYETFQPHSKATHGRQPSNAATHPMIRSAHRVTPSLADAPPRPLQSVDPRDLETRLSKLPEPHMPEQGAPHHRSAHRTMPSMADGSHHTPGGIDPNKLHDRLSRSASPSPEPQHHRGESNHGGWAVLQSIGEDGCDPRASTETQNGNRYRSTDELGASNNHNTVRLVAPHKDAPTMLIWDV